MLALTSDFGRDWSTFEIALVAALIAQWVACAVFTSNVASRKGYNGESWGLGGLLFGVFALIAAAGLPRTGRAKVGPSKDCPDCGMSCPLPARVCGSCRFEFPRDQTVDLMCAELMDGEQGAADWITTKLSETYDPIVAERLTQIAHAADWLQLAKIVPILVENDAVDRLTWLAPKIAATEGEPSMLPVLEALAASKTIQAATLVSAALTRHEMSGYLLRQIGSPAVPVLKGIANEPDKRRAKAARAILKSMNVAVS